MRTSQLSVKGQLVIPAEIREHFGLKPGMRIGFQEKGDGLLLVPMTPRRVDAHKGSLNDGKNTLMKTYFQVREEERRYETGKTRRTSKK